MPESHYEQIVRGLILASPLLAVELLGVILALVYITRHTKPAVCVLIAMLLALAMHFVGPLVWRLALERGLYDVSFMWVVPLFINLVTAGLWGVVLVAVFAWRRGPAPAGDAYVPQQPTGLPPYVASMSQGFYFWSLLIVGVISFPLVVGIWLSLFADEPEMGLLLAVLAFPLGVFRIVVFFMFIHGIWRSIQPFDARITPGQAVGFLFIPLFNLYWVFVALPGFAMRYNAAVQRHNLAVPPVTVGLPVAICILMLLGVIPVVGVVTSLVNLVLLLIFVWKACNAVNALAQIDVDREARPS